MQDYMYGVPTRSHIHLKDQCNTPCRTTASSHAVTAGSRPQGSVQHRPSLMDCGVPMYAINAGSKIEVQHPMQDYGVPARSHGRVKAQCNTPCRALASPHAVTAGSRLSATPRIRDRTSVYMLVELERMYPDTVLNLVYACDPDMHA
jgi:hypothetical protein